MITDLDHFNGDSSDFENWEQLMLLKETYGLTKSYTKVLINTKLKEKAPDWFRSNPNRMKASNNDLLKRLCDMFNQNQNK